MGQSKKVIRKRKQVKIPHFDYLIGPSFQDLIDSLCYYLKIANIENLLKKVSLNIQISTAKGGDYKTVSLFDCPYFSKIISWLQHT